jgi:hypothetical protein
VKVSGLDLFGSGCDPVASASEHCNEHTVVMDCDTVIFQP